MAEWERFCAYRENPAECEGNRLQWNGNADGNSLTVKMIRRDADARWLLEGVSLSSPETDALRVEEALNMMKTDPNYREYGSVAELKDMLFNGNETEESYGSVKGRISSFCFSEALPFPEFQSRYPAVRATAEGYAQGELSDGAENLTVWCSPDVQASDEEQEFQLFLFPGEIPVVYVTRGQVY